MSRRTARALVIAAALATPFGSWAATPQVLVAHDYALTPPLRELAPLAGPEASRRAADVVAVPKAMPPLDASFDGLGNAENVAVTGVHATPAYASGDIGPNHYVQATYVLVRVFNRAGTPVTAPFRMNTLFASLGAGHRCATAAGGSPLVIHDHLADRWLLTMQTTDQLSAPLFQCVAVSAGSDPAGAYHVYAFSSPGQRLLDRGHLGLAGDAYLVTNAEYAVPSLFYVTVSVFVLERAAMLVGSPAARAVYVDVGAQVDSLLLPADLDGPPPPAPRPYLFATASANELGHPQGDAIRLFELDADFADPAAATFTTLPPLAVPAYDPMSPSGQADVPQPGTANRLNAVSGELMHRLQYRHRGTRESLVTLMTVDVSGDPSPTVFRAGLRYHVLDRLPAAAWTLGDGSTFAPADTTHRWMGSAALDRNDNLAIGYSVSDATATFPGIRYAGRLAGDTANLLAQGEAVLFAGSASQTTQNRWGSLSAMSVDPVDDCTYWYTNAYYSAAASPGCSAAICWRTRIASFRYPGCSGPARGTLSGTVRRAEDNAPLAGARIATAGGYTAFTDANGAYTIAMHPGSYVVDATLTAFLPANAAAVAIAAGATTTRDFTLGQPPLLSNGFEDP